MDQAFKSSESIIYERMCHVTVDYVLVLAMNYVQVKNWCAYERTLHFLH